MPYLPRTLSKSHRLVPVAQSVERWTPRFGHWNGTISGVGSNPPTCSSFGKILCLFSSLLGKAREDKVSG